MPSRQLPFNTRDFDDFFYWCHPDREEHMEIQFQSALERLRDSQRSRDNEALAEGLKDLEFTTLEAGKWPAGFFDELEELLKDQSFLSLRNSWNRHCFINNNWEHLSLRAQG